MKNEYSIKRHIEKQVIECVKESKVPCLIGQRQIGKTTLLKAILPKIKKYKFVKLDNPETNLLANSDPDAFMKLHKKPLCIDEIQKAPILFEYIKDVVDSSSEHGQFVLTGSESIPIIKGISERMSTRARILSMVSLSNSEIYKKTNFVFVPSIDGFLKRQTEYKNHLKIFQDIIKGSMPDIINGKTKNISRFYKTYCETTLLKDFKEDMINIHSHSKFISFLKVLSSYVGQEINYSNMATHIGVDIKTIQS
jgi:predicted AAA+ superfamily ATPase